MARTIPLLLLAGVLLCAPAVALGENATSSPTQSSGLALDADAAIARSRAAIGRSLGDYSFRDEDGKTVRLADYRGRPLVISLVFTACSQSCPLIIERLAAAVEVARDAVGPDSFSVITVGFDSRNDTPARMQAFAHSHGVDLPGWRFLSGDQATVDALIEDLGFLRLTSPRGFDHIAQVSLIDSEGRVHGQVYGDDFEVPALVEPLKVLVLRQDTALTDVAAVIRRITLFCTYFDPRSGRYTVNYSFVISIAVGGLALLGLAVFLLRSFWILHRPPRGTA